jgi:phospholipase C
MPRINRDHNHSPRSSWELNRRQFLRGAGATGAAFALGALNPFNSGLAQTVLPPPETSGIDHIVVLMMENRSFDHFLGWMDKADGRQRGLTYFDAAGMPHATHRLSPDFQGCGNADPDHSYEGGRIEFNDGACDGWLRAGNNDDYAIGYYTRKDLTFLGAAATRWTVCDRIRSTAH